MSSLSEIAQVGKPVTIGTNQSVDVFGISAEGLAALMRRFPAVGKLMSGATLEMAEVAKLGPQAVAAFIAAGCGQPGDEKAEAAAGRIALASQLDLIEEIVKQTFPRGVGPFIQQMKAMQLLVEVKSEEPVVDQKVSTPKSDASSRNSLPQDTPTPSDTRPVS